MQFKPYIVAPLVAAPILLILLIMLLITTSSRFRRNRTVTRSEARKAVETMIEQEDKK